MADAAVLFSHQHVEFTAKKAGSYCVILQFAEFFSQASCGDLQPGLPRAASSYPPGPGFRERGSTFQQKEEENILVW